VLRTVDYHTAGEPFRIVTDGAPEIPGDTVLERRERAQVGAADDVRALLCREPRGHADMYGCFLVPPDDDGADLGVLFWHKDGFSTACGHGTIALAAYAIDEGLVPAPPDGEVIVRIDVPSGRVTARATRQEGRTQAIEFTNVASYVLATGLRVETARGPLDVDVSYGGAIYASARAADVRLQVEPPHLDDLIATGREIKAAENGHDAARHPGDARLSGVYGTNWYDEHGDSDGVVRQRNVTVFADGEVDRSPCGSGTSARLALLHDAGRLRTGALLEHSSIIGTRFLGTVTAETTEHGQPAVVTTVEGMAYRTGRHEFDVDPADPLVPGFLLR
jgi:proline racemase/trans-L-3-hydroxyproline dehydratase